jgi:HK97 family phage major capsid protein
MKAELATQIKAVQDAMNSEVKKANDATEALQAEVKAVKEESAGLKAKVIELEKKGSRIPGGGAEIKSFADVVKEAVEKDNDNLQKFIRGEKKSFAVEMDIKAVADFSTANVTGGTVYGAQYRQGIITSPNQIGHVRDFIRVLPGDPTATDFYFMRENGAGEGAPAPTSEKKAAAATTQATGLKPQFDIDTVEASVKYENIAGFMVASKKSLRTIPGIMNFINMRVPQKLFDVEDAQVLYGDGTSPNIKGILVAGNFTAGSAAGATVLAEKIINDLSLLENTNKRMANFGVMRPNDWWGLFKNKAVTSGEYDLPQNVVFVNGTLYIGGVPFYKSTALTANDYFLGSSDGAEILQGESIRVEFFEQDGTNVRTNQMTIRVEETIALPVYGDTFFVKGSSALV